MGERAMDAAQFVERAGRDPQVSEFLREIAMDAVGAVDMDTPRTYMVTGADFLAAVAAYALFRWLKNHFDYKQALNETEVVRDQTRIVEELVREGIEPKAAQAVTVALLDRIAKRGADDPVLKKIRDLTP